MRRVVLITGAARGIGRAIAEDFAKDHDVAISWLTTSPEELCDGIFTARCDLTEAGEPARLVREVLKRFGRLDVIVNNAGVGASSPLDNFDAKTLTGMVDVNLLAAQALVVAALPHMENGSAIVNISSVNAMLPPRGAAIFGATKAALNLWTRGLAKELGPRGIRVNAVAPGAVNVADKPRSTELVELFADETALGRIAEPNEIARAVRFLAGEDAAFITGEVLTVSGGYRL